MYGFEMHALTPPNEAQDWDAFALGVQTRASPKIIPRLRTIEVILNFILILSLIKSSI